MSVAQVIPGRAFMEEVIGPEVRSAGIVLASRSPRRRALLEGAGISHVCQTPAFDDAVLKPGNATPRGWVMSLAFLKAWAAAREGAEGLILGADTACVLDGELIGTPRDHAEAAGMIRSFSGREHEVVTGVALVDPLTGRRSMFADSAMVTMGEIGEEEIERYVSTGGWRGKAGAYNLSERLEAGWPITYEGDPETIMGLPTRLVVRALRADFPEYLA